MRSSLIFLLWIASVAAQAQTALPSADSVMRMALAQNPDLPAYRLRIARAEEALQVRRRSQLPTASASAGFQHNIDRQTTALPGELVGKPGQTLQVQMGTPYAYQAGISVQADLFHYQRRLQEGLAQADVALEQAQEASFRQALAFQALSYYHAAVVLSQALGIHRASQQAADSLVLLAEQRFAQGTIGMGALLQARVQANAAAQASLRAEASLDAACAQLRLLLGLPPQETLSFPDRAAWERLPEQLPLGPDLSLAAYDLQYRRASVEVRTKRAAFLPRVGAQAYFGYQYLGEEAVPTGGWNPYNYVGLNVSLPLFTAFSNKGNLRMAMTNEQISQAAAARQREASAQADALLPRQYRNSLQQCALAEQSYRWASEQEALALQQFEEGLSGLEPYFKAYQDRLQAEQSYLAALSELFTHYSTYLSRP